MPSLYIVATPIGNLEDVTLRALRVLAEVDLIAAEDTRVTRKLLARYKISTPLTSYHEHNKLSKLATLLAALEHKDVALVSDAGMPGINDPGHELVDAAARAGVRVVPVPGASAVPSAIAASGVPFDQYVYLGFLPRKRGDRRRLLGTLAHERRALVAFETPHRLRSALADVLPALGDRRIAVCRELTKVHEEVFRGTVSEALEHFAEARGEFTLVIAGCEHDDDAGSPDQARDLLATLKEEGRGARDSVAEVAEHSGLSRREVYRLWLEVGRPTNEPGQE